MNEKLMKTVFIILVALAISSLNLFATIPGVNVVTNGDFEIFHTSPASFPGWGFTHGFGAFINESGKVASGNNCVFIGGYDTGGDMVQLVRTTIGQPYHFSFYERGDDPGQSYRFSLLNVYWAGQLLGSYTDDNIQHWTYHEFDVVATSPLTRIDFQNADISNTDPSLPVYGNPGIDLVSAIALAPEPSTPNLMITALLVFLSKPVLARSKSCAASCPRSAKSPRSPTRW